MENVNKLQVHPQTRCKPNWNPSKNPSATTAGLAEECIGWDTLGKNAQGDFLKTTNRRVGVFPVRGSHKWMRSADRTRPWGSVKDKGHSFQSVEK